MDRLFEWVIIGYEHDGRGFMIPCVTEKYALERLNTLDVMIAVKYPAKLLV